MYVKGGRSLTAVESGAPSLPHITLYGYLHYMYPNTLPHVLNYKADRYITVADSSFRAISLLA